MYSDMWHCVNRQCAIWTWCVSYLCPVEIDAWIAGRWCKERVGHPPAPEPRYPGHPPSVYSQYDGKPLHCRVSSAHVHSTIPRPPPWPGSEGGTLIHWQAPATLILDEPSPPWCLRFSYWLCRGLEHHWDPVSQLTHWSIFISVKQKKLESASGMLALSYLMLRSSKHLCWSHRLQVLYDCWHFDQPKCSLCPLVSSCIWSGRCWWCWWDLQLQKSQSSKAKCSRSAAGRQEGTLSKQKKGKHTGKQTLWFIHSYLTQASAALEETTQTQAVLFYWSISLYLLAILFT